MSQEFKNAFFTNLANFSDILAKYLAVDCYNFVGDSEEIEELKAQKNQAIKEADHEKIEYCNLKIESLENKFKQKIKQKFEIDLNLRKIAQTLA